MNLHTLRKRTRTEVQNGMVEQWKTSRRVVNVDEIKICSHGWSSRHTNCGPTGALSSSDILVYPMGEKYKWRGWLGGSEKL